MATSLRPVEISLSTKRRIGDQIADAHKTTNNRRITEKRKFKLIQGSGVPPIEIYLNLETQFKIFQSWCLRHKNDTEWCFRQVSPQKYTKTPSICNGEADAATYTMNQDCYEPIFSDEDGLRKTSAYNPWLAKEKNYSDYKALWENCGGDPLKKETDGGMKWKRVLKFIYNSGEMEEARKKNGFNPRMKIGNFFPSGKTDSGRTVSQFLFRLWFMVNKCGKNI